MRWANPLPFGSYSVLLKSDGTPDVYSNSEGIEKGIWIEHLGTDDKYIFYFSFFRLDGLRFNKEFQERLYTNDCLYFEDVEFGIIASDWGFENHSFYTSKAEYDLYSLNILGIDPSEVAQLPHLIKQLNDDESDGLSQADISDMYNEAFGIDPEDDPDYWDQLQIG